MTEKTVVFLIGAALLCMAGADQSHGVSSLSEPGLYFVRARYVTVPLRNDLNWFIFKRDQMGMMRYPGKICYPPPMICRKRKVATPYVSPRIPRERPTLPLFSSRGQIPASSSIAGLWNT